jgi:hypothetical protein
MQWACGVGLAAPGGPLRGKRPSAAGACSLNPGPRGLESGIWSLESGTWELGAGAWSLEPGTWDLLNLEPE